MGKLKIYLDTSVFSAYYDERVKVRQEQTKRFWVNLAEYDKYISEIVMDELNAVTDDELREKLIELTKDFEVIKVYNSISPWRLSWIHFKANQVLELPAGTVNNQINIKDILEVTCIN